MLIREHELGVDGLQWTYRSIRHTRLGTLILSHHSIDSGIAISLLPPDVTDEVAKDLQRGGVLKADSDTIVHFVEPDGSTSRLVPTPSTVYFLAEFIADYLHASDRRLCVFEDQIVSADDPGVRLNNRTFALDGKLYYIVHGPDAGVVEIVDTIRDGNGGPYLTIGVLSCGRDAFEPPVLTTETLTRVAADAEAIVTVAYDGESFVIWRRDH